MGWIMQAQKGNPGQVSSSVSGLHDGLIIMYSLQSQMGKASPPIIQHVYIRYMYMITT